MPNEKKIIRSFGIITVLAIFEKIVSFFFHVLMASSFGASLVSDSYFSSSELLTLIQNTLFTGLTIALLKIYTTVIKTDSNLAEEQLSCIYSNVLFLSAVGFVLIFVFSEPISYLIGPGFSPEGRFLLIRDIRILSILFIVFGATAVYSVVLRYNHDFTILSLRSLFLSVSGIIFVVCSRWINNLPLTIGQVLANVLFFCLIKQRTNRYHRISIQKPKWGKEQQILLSIYFPLIISNGISRVSLMIDKILASKVGEGGVSYIAYAQTLYNFVFVILISNLCIILLSDFNTLVADESITELNSRVKDTLSILVYLLCYITIIAIMFNKTIVKLVFGRGSFSELSVSATAGILLFYSICFVFSAVNNVYIQVFYAYGKTKTTLHISVFSVITNIICSIVLFNIIGLNGIPIGTLVATVIMTVLLGIAIRRIIQDFTSFVNYPFILKVLSIIIISTVGSMIFIKVFGNSVISFVLSTLVCAFLSFLFLLCAHDKYAHSLIKYIRQKLL